MKAVVWTDVFQTGIMLAGMLAAIIQVWLIYIPLLFTQSEELNFTYLSMFYNCQRSFDNFRFSLMKQNCIRIMIIEVFIKH